MLSDLTFTVAKQLCYVTEAKAGRCSADRGAKGCRLRSIHVSAGMRSGKKARKMRSRTAISCRSCGNYDGVNARAVISNCLYKSAERCRHPEKRDRRREAIVQVCGTRHTWRVISWNNYRKEESALRATANGRAQLHLVSRPFRGATASGSTFVEARLLAPASERLASDRCYNLSSARRGFSHR